ncbi:MAG: hypothetical protein ACREP0_08335 [Rhodanobacteraceae bacterium]
MPANPAENANRSRDLTRSWWALLYWGVPIVLLNLDNVWPNATKWLLVAGFSLAGAGCLLNATRCSRTHCLVTGPLFVLAAAWSLLAAVNVVPLHNNLLSAVVMGILILAFLAEWPIGRYANRRRGARDA